MPPRRATATEEQISLRLKHGIHTIFLFVKNDTTFGQISSDLLEILQDRYPKGLTSSIVPPKTTPVPAAGTSEAENIKIAYGIARDPTDLSRGWKSLNVDDSDTVADKELVDLSAVAFSLVSEAEDVDMDDVAFDVELMTLDDELL
ncbi:hypothetical protein QBC37DRAFT_367362 [Rhypophila decipiens]|uniref:Uncharacterized protein n=1 Tax=Rhypophila decipiens TaxID=261697 RepID=A0AAN6YM60_9PEZI|nr:hypothetical protein QBC37DRAFT_367362 [Rhypophila decipiens]